MALYLAAQSALRYPIEKEIFSDYDAALPNAAADYVSRKVDGWMHILHPIAGEMQY